MYLYYAVAAVAALACGFTAGAGAIIDAITDCTELEAERAELNAECDVSMELLRK